MTPHREKTMYFLLILPATPLSLSWTLEGLFELTRNLVHYLWNCRDTRTRQVWCTRRRGPRTPVKNIWRKPWLCVCWKCTFLHQSFILKSQQNIMELVTRPGQHWWPTGWRMDSGCSRSRIGGSFVLVNGCRHALLRFMHRGFCATRKKPSTLWMFLFSFGKVTVFSKKWNS